jgi:hypothetical protein
MGKIMICYACGQPIDMSYEDYECCVECNEVYHKDCWEEQGGCC